MPAGISAEACKRRHGNPAKITKTGSQLQVKDSTDRLLVASPIAFFYIVADVFSHTVE